MAVEARKSSRVTPEPSSAKGKRPKPAPGGRPAKRPSIFRDPRVRLMGFAAIGLVIFYLVVIISSILMGVLASDQPSTAAERDIDLYSAMIEAGAIDESVWAGYARALVEQGQYSRAQEVLDDAEKAGIGDTQVRALYSVQALVYKEQGKYEEAIATVDEAKKLLEDQLAADQAALRAGGNPTPLTATGLPGSYYEMMALQAECYEELGDDAKVIEILTAHLEVNSTAADILEWRGDVYARTGMTAEAIADWTKAMQFLGEPDEIEAIQAKIDGAE